MAENLKITWLKDKTNTKLLPVTTANQVMTYDESGNLKTKLEEVDTDIRSLGNSITDIRNGNITAKKAIQAAKDDKGNIIYEYYETKSDAKKKLTEAKTYTDNIINNAVLHTTQELTDEQQIQAKKNLNLYYQEQILLGSKETDFSENGISIENFVDIFPTTDNFKVKILFKQNDEIVYSFKGNYSHKYYGVTYVDEYVLETITNDEYYTLTLTQSNGVYLQVNSLHSSMPFNIANYLIEIYQLDTNIVPEDYIPESIPRFDDLPAAQIQTDWNQNDETAVDYINGRTHYIKEIQTTIFEQEIVEDKFGIDSNIVPPDPLQVYDVTISNENETRHISGRFQYISNSMMGFFGYCIVSTGGSHPIPDSNLDLYCEDDTPEIVYVYSNIEYPAKVTIKRVSEKVKKINELFIPDTIARTSYVNESIASVVNSAPETLNTLNELATALGNDENFATTVATQIGNKVDKIDGMGLSSNDYDGETKTFVDTLKTKNLATEEVVNAHITDINNPHIVTKTQVGLNNVDNIKQYSADNPPPYPVTSVNGQVGAVAFATEEWTFTLTDGSTVTKKVMLG